MKGITEKCLSTQTETTFEDSLYEWNLVFLRLGFWVLLLIHFTVALWPDQRVLHGMVSRETIYLMRAMAVLPLGIWYVIFKRLRSCQRILLVLNPFILHFFTALPAVYFSQYDLGYYHLAFMQGIVAISVVFCVSGLWNAVTIVLYTLIYFFIYADNVFLHKIMVGMSFYSLVAMLANFLMYYFTRINHHQKMTNIRYAKAQEQLHQRTRELEETKEHLVHMEKMASLGTLVSGIAHEIRNPLAHLKGSYIASHN